MQTSIKMKSLLKTLQDFITESNQTNSNLDKLTVLKKYSVNGNFRDGLEYVYSPFKQYYVTSANCQKNANLRGPKENYTNIFSLLDDLNERKITGHTAISAVNGYVSENSEYADIIWMILDRNLKTRSTTSMINKVIPGCIPTFEVALAATYDDSTKKKLKWSDGWYVSRKLDGCRCICMLSKSGDVKFLSRAGNEFETLGKIREELGKISEDLILDGEICIMDDAGNEDFQGIMKEIKRKNHTIQRPMFMVFDALTVEEFTSQTSTRTFSARQIALSQWFAKYGASLQFVTPLEQIKVESEDDFQGHLLVATEAKWEGLMLRKNTTYQGKRSNDILKVKQFFDAEYQVVEVDMGPHRVIVDGKEVEETMLKNVVVIHKGCKVQVGSGFSQEQRRYYFQNPGEIVGKTITVQYFEQTINEHGGYSLRFPVIKQIWPGNRDL